VDHGYVYVFQHRARGWIKIGMTDKNDPEHCWGRIEHYAKKHALPADGWDMVSFIETPKARELETALHRNLNMFRVTIGRSRSELFYCSVAVLHAALNGLREFIDDSQRTFDGAAEETAEQRIAREAHEIRVEQARLRKAIDDEWTVKGNEPSKYNKRERGREFIERWRNHPIGRKLQEEVEAKMLARAQAAQRENEAVARRAAEAEQARERAAFLEAAEQLQLARRRSWSFRLGAWIRALAGERFVGAPK
jgi:T5orf172 domain